MGEIATHLAAGVALSNKRPGHRHGKGKTKADPSGRSLQADELRLDNAKLEQTLSKVKGLVLLLQKQTEEAECVLDRERCNYQRLEASAKQLEFEIGRELAKEEHLKLTLAARSQAIDVRVEPIVATEIVAKRPAISQCSISSSS